MSSGGDMMGCVLSDVDRGLGVDYYGGLYLIVKNTGVYEQMRSWRIGICNRGTQYPFVSGRIRMDVIPSK